MAITFPLALAGFSDKLLVGTYGFDIGESRTFGETGGGEIISQGFGTSLWSGAVSAVDRYHADQSEVEVLMQALKVRGGTFYIGDMARQYPANDPTGALTAAASFGVSAVGTGGATIALSGMPAGFALVAGDYVSFHYDGGRVALHRLIEGSGAVTGGVTSAMGVVPAIRPNWSPASSVRVTKTYCKASLVPGSGATGARRPVFAGGISFDFRQTLR